MGIRGGLPSWIIESVPNFDLSLLDDYVLNYYILVSTEATLGELLLTVWSSTFMSTWGSSTVPVVVVQVFIDGTLLQAI